MKLLTKPLKEKLIRNHQVNYEHIMDDGNTEDFKPVVKLFDPCSLATWLITELDPESNIMFGLCYIGGQGYPELGDVSLDELANFKNGWGLGIERDMHWTAEKTLSEYADDARRVGYISA